MCSLLQSTNNSNQLEKIHGVIAKANSLRVLVFRRRFYKSTFGIRVTKPAREDWARQRVQSNLFEIVSSTVSL